MSSSIMPTMQCCCHLKGEAATRQIVFSNYCYRLLSSSNWPLSSIISFPKPELAIRVRASSVVTVTETSKQKNKRDSEQLQDIDPAFYEMGYARHLRAYGIEFKEGINGVGIYAAKDIPNITKSRIIMEIPLELMISISKDPPWIFHPDYIPLGHPIFDAINSTDTEVDWDIRLAFLLLFAMDTKGHFWQLYSDFLPEAAECTSLLLATEDELLELQDNQLASTIREQQRRAETAWKKYWTAGAPLKLKRLAPTVERFKWAVAIAQTRHITTDMTVGARPQVANMFIPYLDMMNHSLQPTCSYRWRRKDRMLEVILNRNQSIKAGDELTLSYMDKISNQKYVQLFGFSSAQNGWDKLNFSGNAKIHKDSFLSSFYISGLPDQYYFNEIGIQNRDEFLDGYLLSVARSMPFWFDGDLPFLPSAENMAVKGLLNECAAMLDAYPTTLEADMELLAFKSGKESRRWRVAIEYRVHQKTLIKKAMKALDLYLQRLLY